MLEGLPDLYTTFDMDDLRLGWEPNTAVAVADIWFRGDPIDVAAYHALERAIAAWEELGYTTHDRHRVGGVHPPTQRRRPELGPLGDAGR